MEYAAFVIAIHCWAHRCNLVACVMSDVPEIQEVEHLLSSVFNFFTHSPLRQEELAEMQAACNEQVLRLLRDIKTRWISHYGPAMRLWQQYVPVCLLFEEAASRKGEHRITARNNLRNLMDISQLLTLLTILPIMRILKRLVLVCQKADIFVLELVQAVEQVGKDFQSMRSFQPIDFPELGVLRKAATAALEGSEEGKFQFRTAEGREEEPCLAVCGPTQQPIFFTVSSVDMQLVTLARFNSAMDSAKAVAVDTLIRLDAELKSRYPSSRILGSTALIYSKYYVGWDLDPKHAQFAKDMEVRRAAV